MTEFIAPATTTRLQLLWAALHQVPRVRHHGRICYTLYNEPIGVDRRPASLVLDHIADLSCGKHAGSVKCYVVNDGHIWQFSCGMFLPDIYI